MKEKHAGDFMAERIQRYIMMQTENALSAMYIAASLDDIECQRKSLERSGRYEKVFVVAEPKTLVAEMDCAALKADTTLAQIIDHAKVKS
jgi:hypothetical protein